MDSFYTYILQSNSSGKFYIGSTQNIEQRLERHQSGKVTSTRNKGPWKVVYHETFKTRVQANRREREIKNKKSRIYIQNLILTKEETRPD